MLGLVCLAALFTGCQKEYVHVGENWQTVHNLKGSENSFELEVSGPGTVNIGDVLEFTVRSEKSGRMWLVHVDTDDRVTLLYPDSESGSNWLDKNEYVTIPPRNSGQKIHAVAPAGPATVAFIVTDPDTELYQVLSGQNTTMKKVLEFVQTRPSWSVRHLVVDVK